MKIPVGVSNRHIHLQTEHVALLFGEGYELTKLKGLSQPGQYAAKEVVSIIGMKGEIPNVRILGPVRKHTQIEISKTDSFSLGVNAPIRESGNIEGSASLTIKGPYGEVVLEEGVIIAARHIHFHTEDAAQLNVKNGDRLKVRVVSERSLMFDNVVARVHENYVLDMHIDTDEANAAGLRTGDLVELIGE